ncbi:MAG TPA: LysR family transcriptional regulator [Anaeromyxobacter sp.]|nr:LysR family transcriptional regulator [Anaeromyxobacter sp.]
MVSGRVSRQDGRSAPRGQEALLELQQLQCFIAVLEEGGFKRATARLGITQPALSYQIKRLEEELGVQVFRRGPGGITPTDAGRILVEHAHHVIAAVREAHQAVRELSGGVTGEIRIGAIKCVGQYFLPHVLREIRTNHPGVRPKLVYMDSEELLDALLANKIEVAMVVDPPPDERLSYAPVFDEQISLVAGRGHKFYGRASVDISELKDVTFVALAPHISAGALAKRYLDRQGISFVPALTADDIETVKHMVETGMGVAFLPDMATAEDVTPEGKPARLSRSRVEPTLSLPLSLATWRDARPSLAIDAFVSEVRRIGLQWEGTHPAPLPAPPPPPAPARKRAARK